MAANVAGHIDEVLRGGGESAREIAIDTMRDVRRLVGFTPLWFVFEMGLNDKSEFSDRDQSWPPCASSPATTCSDSTGSTWTHSLRCMASAFTCRFRLDLLCSQRWNNANTWYYSTWLDGPSTSWWPSLQLETWWVISWASRRGSMRTGMDMLQRWVWMSSVMGIIRDNM